MSGKEYGTGCIVTVPEWYNEAEMADRWGRLLSQLVINVVSQETIGKWLLIRVDRRAFYLHGDRDVSLEPVPIPIEEAEHMGMVSPRGLVSMEVQCRVGIVHENPIVIPVMPDPWEHVSASELVRSAIGEIKYRLRRWLSGANGWLDGWLRDLYGASAPPSDDEIKEHITGKEK